MLHSVMQQNIYLTLLPSRPNLVNIPFYECHQNYSHQMPDFSFKMHQIQFRLGLRPRPSQRSPDSLAGFGEGREREKGGRMGGKEWKGAGERGEEGVGSKGEG